MIERQSKIINEQETFERELRDGTFRGNILLSGDSHGRDNYRRFETRLMNTLETEHVTHLLDTGDMGFQDDRYPYIDCSFRGEKIMDNTMLFGHDLWEQGLLGMMFSDNDPESQELIERITTVSQKMPYLILHGHTHEQEVARLVEPTIYQPPDIILKLTDEEKRGKITITSPGIYRINPGRLQRGECALLKIHDLGNYTVILRNI